MFYLYDKLCVGWIVFGIFYISCNFQSAHSFHSTDPKGSSPIPRVEGLPRGIEPSDLIVVTNSHSSAGDATDITNRYLVLHQVPQENRVTLHFDSMSNHQMSAQSFQQKILEPLSQVLSTRPEIQAILIIWPHPSRVSCVDENNFSGAMSITTAVTFGVDPLFCETSTSSTLRLVGVNPLYQSETIVPFFDLGVRPSFFLGVDGEDAEALIQRSSSAMTETFSLVSGNNIFIATSDAARNERMQRSNPSFHDTFLPIWKEVISVDFRDNCGEELYENNKWKCQNIGSPENDFAREESSLLLYFTGSSVVDFLNTNTPKVGAIGDSMTSYGGRMESAQTRAVDFIKAGFSASHGTVTEPWNKTSKFPVPGDLIPPYFRGEPAILAYWKSVPTVGANLFVGDPLTRLGSVRIREDTQHYRWNIESTQLRPNEWFEVTQANGEIVTSGKALENGITTIPIGEIGKSQVFQIRSLGF